MALSDHLNRDLGPKISFSLILLTKKPTLFVAVSFMALCFLHLHRQQFPKITNFVSPLHAAPHNVHLARDERGQSRAGKMGPIR